MFSRDAQMPPPFFRRHLIVCGITGLVISLLWWAWPGSVDPLSALLSRTPLFSRQPGPRPVVLYTDPDTPLNDAPGDETLAPRYQTLFEQLMADAPAVVAFVDIDAAAAAFLKGLTVVDADPKVATILVPPANKNRCADPAALKIEPQQTVGLRSRDGKLHFNVFAGDWRTPDISTSDRTLPFRLAVPANERPSSGLARDVASRYRAATAIPVKLAAGNDLKPVRSQRSNSPPPDEYIVPGAHRRFFDHYPANALVNGRIARGTFHKRIVLLGTMSGSGVPATAGTPFVTAPVAATAVRVWAVLNNQVAGHPHWTLWVEWGLILGLAFCPAVLMRHVSLLAAWIATGALACALTAAVTLAWHLSGILVQPGAAVLAAMLSGLYTSLLRHSHQDGAPKTPSAARPPSKTPLSATAHKTAGPNAAEHSDTAPLTTDTASSSASLAAAAATRERIGRYEILRCIGKGAMGEVFLGRDPHINRLTAIKTLRFKDNFIDDEIAEIRTKFFREAESAGTLSHTNIVTIYDAGEDRERAYIAMEYLEGITLLRFTRAKRLLPIDRIIDYGIQIAKALDYAHHQGIVHRDVKPANIMVLKNGAIKLTDFGIARITASSHTQTGVVKGTPYYMSPEQFSGAKVDGRSDIFSLGTLLFQLLTGTLPFFSESPAVLMNQIMNFPHPNPRAINPRVMPAIVPIVDKALEKDPAQRYPKAAQMAADFVNLKNRIKRFRRHKNPPA